MADESVTGFEDLFNFSDKTPITDAIKLIQLLESTYVKTIGTIKAQNASLASDMDGVKVEASGLLKTVQGMNEAATKNADAYSKVAKSAQDLVTTQDNLKQKTNENNKALAGMNDQVNKLKKSEEALGKVMGSQANSVDDLKAKLDSATKAYKAMGDSTDQAVKDSQLKKIAELNSQYTAASKAINDAKKATDFAAGSYNELAKKVADGKAQLKAMGDGVNKSSTQFKALEKEVKAGTETLKKWDEGIGDNQRNVGDYKGALGSLIPGFQGAAGSIESATTAARAFIATPLGLIIAAIGVAVAALSSYFKGSVEGQDRWNKIMAYGEAIIEVFKDGLESLGKTLVEIWDNPKKAAGEFWDFIKQNIVNRFNALELVFKSIGKIISSGFTDGFKDLANATLQATTGVENLIDKLADAGKAAADEADRRFKIAQALADKENLIRKEKIKDVVDDARTEMKVNELLEQSKDKLKFADEDRLKKVREARKLLNDQLAGDLDLAQLEIDAQKLRIEQAGGLLIAGKKLADYTNQEITQIGVKYELIEELAKLEADQIKLQADASVKRKALQKQEIQLIQEISNAYWDRVKREQQAQNEIDTYVINATIKKNNEILADEDRTLEASLEAFKSNAEEQQKLLELNQKKTEDALLEAALAKVELDSETSNRIFTNQKLSLEQQLDLEKKTKEAVLLTDARYADEKQIYITQLDKANKEYTDNVIATNKKTVEEGQKNIFKVLDRDLKIFNSNLNATLDDEMTKLNKSYTDGTISMNQYQKEKARLTAEGARARLQVELEANEQLLGAAGLTGQQIADLEAKNADLRKQISEQSAEELLQKEQKLRDAINNLVQEGFAFAQQMINQTAQMNIDSLNTQLAAEQAKHDRSISLAGDDAQAKALIDQQLANKKIAIEKKISQEKRKVAIANKAISAAETIINTAKAVVAALPNYPLAVAVGVIGALELAAIISQPIPQFAKGTESSPEGLALVGEAGRELVFDPSGKTTLVDKPTVMHLKGGSIVKNNAETESLMATAEKFGDGYLFNQRANAFTIANQKIDSSGYETALIVDAVNRNSKQVASAIKQIETHHWDDEGYRRFTRENNAKIELLNKKKHKF